MTTDTQITRQRPKPNDNRQPITATQESILMCLYLFRFLSSNHIQALLGHKSKSRINEWLSELMAKGYVLGSYAQTMGEINKPAVYKLGLQGIRFLKTRSNIRGEVIARIYRDNLRSKDFVDRCLLVADMACAVNAAYTSRHHYRFETRAGLAHPECGTHFLTDASVSPDLVITSTTAKYLRSYLVQVLSATMPAYKIRSTIYSYVDFITSNYWCDNSDSDLRAVILICADYRQYTLASRYFRKALEQYDDPSDIRIRIRIRTEVQIAGAVRLLNSPINNF